MLALHFCLYSVNMKSNSCKVVADLYIHNIIQLPYSCNRLEVGLRDTMIAHHVIACRIVYRIMQNNLS